MSSLTFPLQPLNQTTASPPAPSKETAEQIKERVKYSTVISETKANAAPVQAKPKETAAQKEERTRKYAASFSIFKDVFIIGLTIWFIRTMIKIAKGTNLATKWTNGNVFENLSNKRLIEYDKLSGVKELKEAFNRFMRAKSMDPEIKEHCNFSGRGNLVLFGPTSTGKTETVLAYAKKVDADVAVINKKKVGSYLKDKEVIDFGGLCNFIKDHAKNNPQKEVIVLFDEFEQFIEKTGEANRAAWETAMQSALRQELQDFKEISNIRIIAITNHIPKKQADGSFIFEHLDNSVIQRLGQTIEVGLPDKTSLKDAMKYHMQNHTKHHDRMLSLTDADYDKIAEMLHRQGANYRQVEDLAARAFDRHAIRLDDKKIPRGTKIDSDIFKQYFDEYFKAAKASTRTVGFQIAA